MAKSRWELTKEKYEMAKAMPIDEAEMAICGMTMVCGYGVYSFKLLEENGKYFVEFEHGTSCD